MKRIPSGLLALGVVLACTVAPPAAAGDAPVAQALFDQAKRALSAGRYAEACAKFEESYRLQEALGTRLNLAACYEAQGRLATAWTTFLEVASKARAAGQKERARVAAAHAAALAPKLSNLSIDVPDEARMRGLQILRDGSPVGPVEWGSPLPVDPGEHSIEASAPDHKPWSTTVSVPAGAATVRVLVPKLEAVHNAATAESGEAPAPVRPPASVSPAVGGAGPNGAAGADRGQGLVVAGWVTGGLGVAGLAAGGVLGLLASSAWNDSRRECSVGACPSPSRTAALSDHDKAVALGNGSTGAFIAGGVLAALGVTLLLIPRDSNRVTGLRVVPRLALGPGTAALDCTGEF